MSQKLALLTLSVAATAAISAERFVTESGAHAAPGEDCLGVSCTSGAVGEMLPVDVIGTTIVTAGGTFSKTDGLAVGANGKAVAAADGDVIVARALQDASGDGVRVEVLLIPNAVSAVAT